MINTSGTIIFYSNLRLYLIGIGKAVELLSNFYSHSIFFLFSNFICFFIIHSSTYRPQTSYKTHIFL